MNDLDKYVRENSAHETGHMTVLFKADRFAGLYFLPHEKAANGIRGVIDTRLKTQSNRGDCPAFAAGMVAEVILPGQCDPERCLDDREQVQRLTGQILEDFAPDARAIIEQDMPFFELLHRKAQQQMSVFFYGLCGRNYAALPQEMQVLTLADVEFIHELAKSKK